MSSRLGRDGSGTGGARRPREPPEQELQRRREQRRQRHDAQSFYENLLLDLSRKMRLSQKTVYQMSQAMNMPGNFWPTHQPKDFGCHWGKKSKSCSAREDPMYDIIRENKRHEKDVRMQHLKQLLEDSTSDEDGSSSSSPECKEKHKKKKTEKHTKKKKEKKKKKKRKQKSSKSNESSDSE